MNKRIKKKITKKTNIKRHNDILKEIEDSGFTVDKKVFGDGYFIFTIGTRAVSHFTIKETPDWKYAIWLSKNGYQIFGEHIELIDKFKPSRTYLSYENDTKEFIVQLQNIKKYPKLYFVDSLTMGDALVDFKEEKTENDSYFYGYQVKRKFNEETNRYDIISRDETITQENFVEKEYNSYFNLKQKQLEYEEHDRIYAFKFFKELVNVDDGIIAVGIYDGNKGNYRTSPRYTIRVVVDTQINKEEDEALFNKINELVYTKRHSTERKTYEHQFDFYGTFDSLDDIKYSDYKYVK